MLGPPTKRNSKRGEASLHISTGQTDIEVSDARSLKGLRSDEAHDNACTLPTHEIFNTVLRVHPRVIYVPSKLFNATSFRLSMRCVIWFPTRLEEFAKRQS